MNRTVASCILFFLVFCLSEGASAQNGSQDTSFGGGIRPRRETYIIEPYPSPAATTKPINIAYYNHNSEETALRIVDVLDRTVIDLQPRQFVENGTHKFTISPRSLASGTYFIRLTTYTSTGSQKQVQDLRFIVVH